MKTKTFGSSQLRKELVKIMPGYSWTVHRQSPLSDRKYLKATGVQTSGFNRLSTLQVIRLEKEGVAEYEVKSAGFGLKAEWLSTATGKTLAKALRSLQNEYEDRASTYSSHALSLRGARSNNTP